MLAETAGEDAGTEGDALAALQAAEADRRLRFPDEFQPARHSAYLDGFSLHAGVRVHENDREGLERLCRYALRPPLSLKRLSLGEDGKLVYRMKRPRGGSLWLVLTPDELVARLATLVPPPRTHAVRYNGVFAPNAKVRRQLVPAGGAAALPVPEPPATAATPVEPAPVEEGRRELAQSAGTTAAPGSVSAPRYRVPWAELLQKVFAVDVLECPRCGETMKLIAFIAEGKAAKRILDHLGIDAQAPPLARAQAPPGSFDPAPDYDAPDLDPGG